MALRAAAARLNGFKPGAARDTLQPSAFVRADRPNDAVRQLRAIQRIARQNGTLKKVFRIQRREHPCDARTADLMATVYYRKWHHLKYCTQVIKYSVNRGLRLRDEAEAFSSGPQVLWAEGVSPSLLGSGRLQEAELEPQTMRREGAEKAAARRAKRELDRGYSKEALRSLAEE
mmetsp:Transcript_139717/g.434597  ORF Transcript_139717/g.434597 Transcript_139717/m.434597 type:complete len:174 (-) Transcript_139717:80-601(-)|eukprot:CAMPEP_0204571636 /NCGR_PEP_ID=MMETSP0661-20131031/39002_1 /ASSEMBLY_ACC=CAM_ASM_000606 /TAXON_ID=109239 /ORGANISM="Alexandrium margalefi, Strain AMGDE01CS-322" /LENGTH=173 /DNA_ID=CAMNT_0051579913 /DNA_START=86 /DNA_END=607 /DNA_ORIENTATION=-